MDWYDDPIPGDVTAPTDLGYSDTTEEVQDWQNVDNGGTMEGWKYQDGVWTDPAGKSYDLSYLNIKDKSALSRFISYAKKMFGGEGSVEDYMQLLPFLGGLFGANQSSNSSILNPGYQGGIPQVTATRTMLTQPPAGRRPGSGGINYGGDVTYTRTGQNLSAENAGISAPISQPLGGTGTAGGSTAPIADIASLIDFIQQLQAASGGGSGSGTIGGGGGGGAGAMAAKPTVARPPAGPNLVVGPGDTGERDPNMPDHTRADDPWYLANRDKYVYSTNSIMSSYSPTGGVWLPKGEASATYDPKNPATYGSTQAVQDIQNWWQQNQGKASQAELDKFLTLGYSPELIAQAVPQFNVADLRNAIAGAQQRLQTPSSGYTPERVQNIIEGAQSTAGSAPRIQNPFPPAPAPAAPSYLGDIQNWYQQNQGGSAENLDKFLATSGFTAQQISEALPQFGVSDLEKAIAGAQQRVMPMAKGGLMPDGFVIPADVVSHLGNGSSEAGLELLAEELGAKPIKGDGDGMSDSIPTTIGGKQPARVANEEAFVPPDVVKKLGGGDTERGAKKLYAMMDRIRKARTGTTEQGKEINPEKFMPGGKVNRYAAGGTATGATAGGGLASQSLADWVGPYVADMLGKGQALTEMPYTAYTGPLTAGASPLQQQAFQAAGNLQAPSQYGQAAGIAGGLAMLAPNLRYTPQTTDFLGRANVSGIDVAPSYGMSAPQPAATTSGFKGPSLIGEQNYNLPPRTPPGISVPAPAPAAPNPLYKGNGPRPEDMFTTQPVEGLPEMFTTQPVELQSTPFTQPGLPAAPAPSQPVGNIAQQYMNPYIESVVSPQLRELTRQADIARGADAARMAKAGAFGGSRQAIMEAEGRRNLMEKQSDVLGQGYATAYDKAMAQFNADQARRAAEAQFGATYGMEGVRTGLQGAQTLGQLGSQQQQSTIDNLRALAELGGVQRGIESEGIAADKAQFEEARLNPYKMLQFQQSLLSGLPLASQSLVQPGQSNLQQFAGGFSTIAQALSYLYPNLFKNQAAPAKG